MRWRILLAAFVLCPLVGRRENHSAGRPAPAPGGPLEVTGNDAETEDKGVQDPIEVIREEVRRTQDYVRFLEDFRDHQLEKIAALEAKKAKTEAETAALGKRLAGLEELWNLDGDCSGGRPP